MKIIIAGLGAVGMAITEDLVQQGHDIVVIDALSSKIENAVSEYDVKGVVGNCASREILKEARVSSADLLIATTSNDELNILACIMAKKYGVSKTIARSSKEEYSTLFNDEELGVNLTVNPQKEAALAISRQLRFPGAINVNQFSETNVELIEIRVPAESPLIGVQLKDLSEKFEVKILICAVQRDYKPIIPSGLFTIQEEDRLFITSTRKDITTFFKKLKNNKPIKDCFIIGGSVTAQYLCKDLEKSGVDVKILEKNKRRAYELAQNLPKCEIIHADGTDQEVLMDEQIYDFDAFVSLTNSDEQNIITSMFAASQGIKKVITKIDQMTYYDMLQKNALYSAISTKTAAVEQVLRFVRLLENKKGSGIKRLFHIMDETAEILEFRAEENFKKFDIPIQQLSLKRDLLIAGIIRDGELIIPNGQTVFKPEDNVIIVTLEEGFNNLNDILDL